MVSASCRRQHHGGNALQDRFRSDPQDTAVTLCGQPIKPLIRRAPEVRVHQVGDLSMDLPEASMLL
jgi:hypothetical protein